MFGDIYIYIFGFHIVLLKLFFYIFFTSKFISLWFENVKFLEFFEEFSSFMSQSLFMTVPFVL